MPKWSKMDTTSAKSKNEAIQAYWLVNLLVKKQLLRLLRLTLPLCCEKHISTNESQGHEDRHVSVSSTWWPCSFAPPSPAVCVWYPWVPNKPPAAGFGIGNGSARHKVPKPVQRPNWSQNTELLLTNSPKQSTSLCRTNMIPTSPLTNAVFCSSAAAGPHDKLYTYASRIACATHQRIVRHHLGSTANTNVWFGGSYMVLWPS